jgi:1-deoxy-D-xylulose-5-phosphate reductoisomerase
MPPSGFPRGVALLGSTGSIGRTTLDVLRRQQEHFRLVAMTAGRNREQLEAQVAEWQPSYAALAGLSQDSRWPTGPDVLVEAATHPDADIVVNAVVGAAGLEATLAALRAGKRVALANKETLVMAGDLVAQAACIGGGEVVPIDSEHSAVLQCVTGKNDGLARLILTASGGPFREWEPERVWHATIEAALQHPTWRMGNKITVDCATLANKALELIEAHYLFGLPYDALEVVVHPQSVVHAFAEFHDGSVLAQLGFPSMELPILYALTHPERLRCSRACRLAGPGGPRRPYSTRPTKWRWLPFWTAIFPLDASAKPSRQPWRRTSQWPLLRSRRFVQPTNGPESGPGKV